MFKSKLGVSFEDLLRLVGDEDLLKRNSTLIQKLLRQKEEFEGKKMEWGITYKDVLRLTDGDELKYQDKPLTTMLRLNHLDEEFQKKYNLFWYIQFKDVIRLTTKKDMKKISPIGENPIPILVKIHDLYATFSKYNNLWSITFQDVIDLTENLNFPDAEQCPAILLVKSWYVPNFVDVWGRASFSGFFNILKTNPTKRAELVGKVTQIVEKERKERFLTFLPAKFSYDGKDLSVNGYIQIFYDGRNGTVRDRGAKETRPSFLDGNARTICSNAGYADIADGWSNGKYCDGKGYDRSSLRCLISGLKCFGSEGETIGDCRMDQIVDPKKPSPQPKPQPQLQPQSTQTATTATTDFGRGEFRGGARLPLNDWDHKEDVAIKCNF